MKPRKIPQHLFDEKELEVIQDVLDVLEDSLKSEKVIWDNLRRLSRLGELVRSYPSLNSSSKLGQSHRSRDTLVRHLTKNQPESPLDFPLKIRLARDFIYAKTHLFRALGIALDTASESQQIADLKDTVVAEIGQSIYTLLVEDLLSQIMTDHEANAAVRESASFMLINFWEDTIQLEIDDFCPVLESAWEARNKLVLDYGTLMGSMEIMRLMASASDPQFMELFLGESTTRERQAFEEFLFGLSHEQINKLRKEMNLRELTVVDSEWVMQILKLEPNSLFSGVLDPEAMFNSFRARKLAAAYRAMRNSRGPKRTAEFFMMVRILESG
ncbi:MAG: hypothetical protein QF437_01625 [Planctomycetota bacterium]|nr:hypothetical protein [Planctomycetota bacterium]MDP7129152.1 hypothetical protein [Planctomycetota bacterium]